MIGIPQPSPQADDPPARRTAPDSHGRSLAKAVSWRITGSLDTFLLSWLISGHALLAGGIAGTEVMTKIALYYLHERAWAGVRWGRSDVGELRRRSMAKALSWRTTGTIDTFLIGWLITGHALVAGGIAASEVVTKLTLFYLHERAWSWVAARRAAMAEGLRPEPMLAPALRSEA